MFFEHDKGKTHSSASCCSAPASFPYRGSWLDFEFDPKDASTSASTAAARCRSPSCCAHRPEPNEEILAHFFVFDTFP